MADKKFAVDNILIHNSEIFGRKPIKPNQIPFPFPENYLVKDIFTTHDKWVALGLYSLLDRMNPTSEQRCRPSDILAVMEYAKRIADTTEGFEVYHARHYELLFESLHRLRTIEIPLTWRKKIPRKKGQNDRGRPREVHRRVVSILQDFGYGYIEDESEDPYSVSWEDVNKTIAPDGMESPPILRRTDRRYSYVSFRFSSLLVEGLVGGPLGIGFTLVSDSIFALRPQLANSPRTLSLLLWILRHNQSSFTTSLDNIGAWAGHTGKPSQIRKRGLKDLEKLQELGVIKGLKVSGTTAKFDIAGDWDNPQLKGYIEKG